MKFIMKQWMMAAAAMAVLIGKAEAQEVSLIVSPCAMTGSKHSNVLMKCTGF
jgi:hypothetical protein